MASVPRGEQQHKILGMLSRIHEMTAVDMLKRDPSLAEGTVYATLLRLENNGFVTSRKEEVSHEPGRPRRFYRITGLGVRAFQMSQELAHVSSKQKPRMAFWGAW